MSPRHARLLSRSIAALSLATIAAGLASGVAFGTLQDEPGSFAFAVVFTLSISAFAIVGLLISSRLPSNPIGWLLGAIGLLFGLTLAGAAYAGAQSAVGQVWSEWLTNVTGSAVAPLLAIALLLFPDGHPLSRRWRVAVWIAMGAEAFMLIGVALTPGAFEGSDLLNPVGIDVLGGSILEDGGLGWLLLPIAALAAGTSVILRYRRSSGVEREQLKWLAFAAGCFLVGFIANELTYETPASNLGIIAIQLGVMTVPLATGAAILQYRLYDIDIVISKTVVVALLAAFITAVYVGLVVGVGALVPADDLALSIAATAAIALLFEPARERAHRVANRLVYGVRATPYEVMTGFSQRMAESLSVDDVLPQMAEVAGRGVGATSATISVTLPNGIRAETWSDNNPDGGEPARAFPVSYQGEDVGAIAVRKGRAEPLTHAEEALLTDLARQAGLALHNVRLHEELAIRLVKLDGQATALRMSRERLVTARDAQRRGLQRDINEGPEHELRLLRQRLEALGGTSPAAVGDALDALGERANATLETLRDLARGIFPPLLADQGIVAALEAHIRKVGANAKVEAGPGLEGRRFDADVEACVYFCGLQAIQNVLRHAGNARCRVRLATADQMLSLEIADEGPGFDPATTARGMGLDIMQDRVDALEGSLTTASAPGAGTTVRIRIPVEAHEAVVV